MRKVFRRVHMRFRQQKNEFQNHLPVSAFKHLQLIHFFFVNNFISSLQVVQAGMIDATALTELQWKSGLNALRAIEGEIQKDVGAFAVSPIANPLNIELET